MGAISIGMLGRVKRKTACRSGRKKHEQRLALACAALANHRFQSIQGTVCASVKVGDLSFTQSDGQTARKELMEMVGDLIDSQGVCLKGVEICPAR